MHNIFQITPSKWALLSLTMLLFSFNILHAQYSMSGPSGVSINESHQFDITGDTSNIFNTTWSVTGAGGATIVWSTPLAAMVQFTGTGTVFVNATVQDYMSNYHIVSKIVTVNSGPPATPGNPIITSNSCGQAVLQQNGTPPGGTIDWYWQQQNASGQVTTYGSANTYTANLGDGNYYIRAYDSSSGLWSNGLGATYVTMASFLPGAISGNQSICSGGDPNVLGDAISPSGGDSYTYQWEYSDVGSSGPWSTISGATNISFDPGPLTNSRWYRRAVTACSQTTETIAVEVTVTAAPTWYADLDEDGFGDPNISQVNCTAPAGYVSDNSDQCPLEYGTNNGCDYQVAILSDENSVYTRTYRRAMANSTEVLRNSDILENATYFDGLGRPMQQVAIKASGKALERNVVEWDMDWTEGSGGTPFFDRKGEVSENEREYGLNPFGSEALLWKCGNDASSGPDGGWDTNHIAVDINATYQYAVWVKRTHSQNGKTYHGPRYVDNLSGGANSNPYFWSGDLPQLETWYLLVGIVHPNGYTGGDTGVSGVYDLQGNKVLDGTEFKWSSTTTTSRFRSYFFYSTDIDARQFFWNPSLQKIDGGETPISTLVNQEIPGDLITEIEYDNIGRQKKEWLPHYVTAGTTGNYRFTTQVDAKSLYQGKFQDDFVGMSLVDVNPYSEKDYEASPLNRVERQGAPGKDWKLDNGNEIILNYEANAANEVRLFSVNLSLDYTPTLSEPSTNAYYLAGELEKTITKDENWTTGLNHTTEEFKDQLGRVVLKRTYSGSEEKHDTYYVYDKFGSLSYVLSPEMDATSASLASLQTALDDLGYQYKYDKRNRLVEKKIPGKGWEYIVYNSLDQPILTQDALQRGSNEWLFTKYDAFGRIVYTGIYDHGASADQGQMQAALDAHYTGGTPNVYETKQATQGSYNYYSNDAFPNTGLEVLTVQYYDNYTFDTDGLVIPTGPIVGQNLASSTKGLATGSKVKVLETSPGDWITTINVYDSKGRTIYVASKNSFLNTTDISESLLAFDGKVLQTEAAHTRTGYDPITTTDFFFYDNVGRLIGQNQMLGGDTKTLYENHYDELGQMAQKKVGGTPKDVTNFTDLVGVSVSGNTVTSTASNGWGNSGFATADFIEGDGYVEWTVATTVWSHMVGLSDTNPNAHYNTIDYALYCRTAAEIRIYENGTNKGSFGTYAVGDTFRVERNDSTVKYYHNGSLLYTSTVPSTSPLQADASFYYINGSIDNFTFRGHKLGLAQTALQTVDYEYNVRGWLKKINDPSSLGNDLFGFEIKYNDPQNFGGTENPDALFNGNISQTLWNSLSPVSGSNPISERYSYTYDALNRITIAEDNTGNYSLGSATNPILYDKNGNITSLYRYGHTNSAATSFGLMDKLQYSYTGNQLDRVEELSGGNTSYGFKDGNVGTDDYAYDINGNMTKDLNKDIETNGITYNHLNLPVEVKFDNNNQKKITYIYDALGTKLEKTVTDGSSVTTEYAGNYVYEGGSLQFFNHPEGYLEPNSSTYDYIYQYKDHLGNIRVSYKDVSTTGIPSLEIQEENNYYPFGLKHKGYNAMQNGRDHKFEYNGVEFNEDLGLNLMAMELRQFDPAIARWTGIDPLTHYSTSTYNGFDNNPIYWADPSGAAVTRDGEGNYVIDGDDAAGAFINLRNSFANSSDDCPSCETEEDWQNYYSQARFTATMLGEGFGGADDLTGRLTAISDESGRRLYYVDGKLQDIVRHNNRADAFFSVFDPGLFLVAVTANIWKVLGLGDDAVRGANVTAKTGLSTADDFKKLITPLDEFDDATTLFRGTTGSESKAGSIFFTDNASVAATYVKNGGSVKQFRISNFAISSLEQSGHLQKFTGIHGTVGKTSTEYKFIGKELVNAINQLLK
ncbi:MAG: DUF6443 domain-containing protein [Flavobacteriaceae bacterium]